MLRWNEGFAAHEKRRVIDIHRKAEWARILQGEWNVRRFEEAMMHLHAVETLAKLGDFHALVGTDHRRVVDDDVDENDALVQDAVVLQIVQQRRRDYVGAGVKKHRRSGHPQRRLVGAFQEQVEGQGFLAHDFLVMAAAVAPSFHHEENGPRDGER